MRAATVLLAVASMIRSTSGAPAPSARRTTSALPVTGCTEGDRFGSCSVAGTEGDCFIDADVVIGIGLAHQNARRDDVLNRSTGRLLPRHGHRIRRWGRRVLRNR